MNETWLLFMGRSCFAQLVMQDFGQLKPIRKSASGLVRVARQAADRRRDHRRPAPVSHGSRAAPTIQRFSTIVTSADASTTPVTPCTTPPSR